MRAPRLVLHDQLFRVCMQHQIDHQWHLIESLGLRFAHHLWSWRVEASILLIPAGVSYCPTKGVLEPVMCLKELPAQLFPSSELFF